jgi:sugar/nucleoside kinase (ribokinase family)
MPPATLDVLAIGNAIVDVLARVEDSFLTDWQLAKGSMRLIDEAEAERLYAAFGPAIEVSGGSAANTVAGVASLGGAAGFIGKVRADQLGGVFAHDIRAAGVSYAEPGTADGPSTGRCLIAVTPDGERTMNTFLGASALIGPEDIAVADVAAAGTLYLEGYLFDRPAAKQAFEKAAAIARAAGRRVALTLSDSFCVARHRDDFLALIGSSIDVLFANEAEAKALFRSDDLDRLVAEARRLCPLVALTRSAFGSVIITADATHAVPAERVDQVVDVTGAGDLYAAGFLFGLSRGKELAACARLGTFAAAEIITHFGARPLKPLRQQAEARGLL